MTDGPRPPSHPDAARALQAGGPGGANGRSALNFPCAPEPRLVPRVPVPSPIAASAAGDGEPRGEFAAGSVRSHRPGVSGRTLRTAGEAPLPARVAPRTARRQHNPYDGRSRTSAVARGPGSSWCRHSARDRLGNHSSSRRPPACRVRAGAGAGTPRNRRRHAWPRGDHAGSGTHRGASAADGDGTRPAEGALLKMIRSH